MWLDFSDQIKQAIDNQNINSVTVDNNGDWNLKYDYSSTIIRISAAAYFKSISQFNSLEYFDQLAREINRELPFICLIDESQLLITKTYMGEIGQPGYCEWDANLIATALELARDSFCKIMLGHTHPHGFGALCSGIYYKRTDDFGGDYLDLMDHITHDDLISNFHLIMSPFDNQLGIFEVKTEGRITYHPWIIAP